MGEGDKQSALCGFNWASCGGSACDVISGQRTQERRRAASDEVGKIQPRAWILQQVVDHGLRSLSKV